MRLFSLSHSEGISGNKLVISSDCKSSDKMGIVRRPQNPPPPAPNPSSRLSNGRSTESISSMASDIDVGSVHNPVPPPRRVRNIFNRYTRSCICALLEWRMKTNVVSIQWTKNEPIEQPGTPSSEQW